MKKVLYIPFMLLLFSINIITFDVHDVESKSIEHGNYSDTPYQRVVPDWSIHPLRDGNILFRGKSVSIPKVKAVVNNLLNGQETVDYRLWEVTDTLSYNLIPEFADLPDISRNKIGVHDPILGVYYVAPFQEYLLQYEGMSAGSDGEVTIHESYCNLNLPDLLSQEKRGKAKGRWGHCAVWIPTEKWQLGDTKFHPDKFNGVRQLKRHEIEIPDVREFSWFLDSLKNRGLQTDSSLDSLKYLGGCAGDDADNIDYYRLVYYATSDTIQSKYEMIVKRDKEVFAILKITATLKPPHKIDVSNYLQIWEYNKEMYINIAEFDDIVNLLGPVDLQFDGVYEIVILEQSWRFNGSGWSNKIIGEDGKQIGQGEIGGDGC